MFAMSPFSTRCTAVRAPRSNTHKCRSAAATSVPADSLTELRLRRARMLYEDVWTRGKVLLLKDIMTEDHIQRDVVWQPENTGGGRDRLKRGVLAYRTSYPDLTFTVTDVAACSGSDRVFIAWRACGTNLGPVHTQAPTGRRVTFSGITLLTFDSDGRIQESQVYRQAPTDEASFFISQGSPLGLKMDGQPHPAGGSGTSS